MESQSHAGEFAVVTGASSGIGYELAREFGRHGFSLLLAAEDPGIATAADRIRELGVDVEAVQVDLSKYEGVESLYQRIRATGKPLDAIVINSGVGLGGEFVRTELKDDISLIQLNVISCVHLTKRILGEMVRRGLGRILYTSSVASGMPSPRFATDAASMAFVQSFAEAIRNEVADQGVIVTSLGRTESEDPVEAARQGFAALMAGSDLVVKVSFGNRLRSAPKQRPKRAS